MHRALLLPDVFLTILDFVAVLPKEGFYEGHNAFCHGNPSFARLARTCRAFLEPCLDALWQHQLTLGPLVKTLPVDTYEETVHSNKLRPYGPRFFNITLTRPFMRSDWVRFDYYAARIRRLGYLDLEYGDLVPTSWQTPSAIHREREVQWKVVADLCFYRRSRWILPNLTHLRWNVYDVPYTDFLPMLLGPRLRMLSYAFQPIDWSPPGTFPPSVALRYVARFLPSLVDLCPSLRELKIHPRYPEHVVVAARGFAERCTQLETYHVDTSRHLPFDRDFLTYLAMKPCLREAFIWVDSESAAAIPLLSGPPVYHPFPALQVLYFQATRLRFCPPLFDAMQHCRLFSLTIEVHAQPLAVEVADLFAAVRKHCDKYTLHVFQIVQRSLDAAGLEEDIWPATKSDHFISIDILSILFHFPNIRAFNFALPMYAWLTDDDLRMIAAAWPGLVSLALYEIWGSKAVLPASWEGVATIITRCPMLSILYLPFDTTRNLDAVRGPDVRPSERLRGFNVFDSILPEDPAAMAQALFSLAPRIEDVFLQGPDDYDPQNPDAYIPFDFVAYRSQVLKILCRMREEHFGDEYRLDPTGKNEIASASEENPKEWNPWG